MGLGLCRLLRAEHPFICRSYRSPRLWRMVELAEWLDRCVLCRDGRLLRWKIKAMKSSPLKRTPLRRVSTKRAAQLRIYAKKRKAFLAREENQICPVDQAGFFGENRFSSLLPATEIHHLDGRENELLLDESKWLAVSREGHSWIHAHSNEARKRGWLV